MNIIITAGGTRERIDTVRSIANEATGRLGSLIAEEFSRRLAGKKHTIYYLCGIGALLPQMEDEDMKIIRIEGTDQLQQEMETLLKAKKIDAVIHSMAVSDYKVAGVTTPDQIVLNLSGRLKELTEDCTGPEWERIVRDAIMEGALQREQKISSDLETPLLILEKTPKIISMIKETSPDTILVGFKLLSGVGRDRLLDTAFGLMQKNQCDFVLANDTVLIQADRHEGYLVDRDRNYQKYETKEQIAMGIADSILNLYGGMA